MIQPVDLATLDITNPEHVLEQFTAARDYREMNFDKLYDTALRYDENYSTGIKRDIQQQYLAHVVERAIVSRNLDRKQAALGNLRVNPVVHSEIPGLGKVCEVHEAVLRWGFRVSGAQNVLHDRARDMLNIGRGWVRNWWNPAMLGGMGAPQALTADIFDIFIDPRSRETDINKDCRWVFEVQYYTRYDLERMFPQHFMHYSPKSFQTMQETITEDQEGVSQPVSQIGAREGGLFPVIRCEFMVDMGQRKSLSGVLDPGNLQWIADSPLIDNGLGCYTYTPVAVRNARRHAYPVPPTRHEWADADQQNLFESLLIDAGLKTSTPRWWVEEGDALADDELARADANLPGAILHYRKAGQPPILIQGLAPDAAMKIAEYLSGRSSEGAQISQIQRGVAPSNVSSGRAVMALQEAADEPMNLMRRAFEEAAGREAYVIHQLCKGNITGYREILDTSYGRKTYVPLNVPQSNPRFNEVAYGRQDADPIMDEPIPPSEDQPAYLSATWQTPTGEPRVGDARQALQAARMAPEQFLGFEMWLNLMSHGELEVSAQLSPDLNQEQRAALADRMFSLGVAGPLYLLRESGVDNPSKVLQEADERNQTIAIAKMLQENPELMAIFQQLMAQQQMSNQAPPGGGEPRQ